MGYIEEEIKKAEAALAEAKALRAQREADVEARAFELVKDKHRDVYDAMHKVAAAEFAKADKEKEARREAAADKRKQAIAAKKKAAEAAKQQPQPQQQAQPQHHQGFGHQG